MDRRAAGQRHSPEDDLFRDPTLSPDARPLSCFDDSDARPAQNDAAAIRSVSPEADSSSRSHHEQGPAVTTLAEHLELNAQTWTFSRAYNTYSPPAPNVQDTALPSQPAQPAPVSSSTAALAPAPTEQLHQTSTGDDETAADIDDIAILEYLADGQFSSPSILAYSSPLRSTNENQTTPTEEMPVKRRRRAAAAAATRAARSPTPATVAGPSTGTPTRASARLAAAATSAARAIPTEMSPTDDLTVTRWLRRQSVLSSEEPPAGRTSVKRRRGGEPVSQPTASASRGAPTREAAIADGGSPSMSSSSQASSQETSQASSSSSGASGTSAFGASGSINGGASQRSRPDISLIRPKREVVSLLLDDDDLFGPVDDDDEVEVVNLTTVDRPQAASKEGTEEEKKPPPPPASRKVRLATLQCVICMDDVTNMTVTHCGHVFCGECLHSSLHINAARRICPICRQKIEIRKAGLSIAKTARSYFPLQIKVMPRRGKGKQPEGI